MNWLKVTDYYSNNKYLINISSIASIKEITEFGEGDEYKTLVQINLIGFDVEDYLTIDATIDQLSNRLSVAAHTIQDL